MAFVVVYDATALYPHAQRDLLIRIAQAGLVQAKWTAQIVDEMAAARLRANPGIDPAKLDRLTSLLNHSVPDCLVWGYEALAGTLKLPDPDRRHVLAAAVRAGAQVIVTTTVRDFPSEDLAEFGIEARTPDDFVLDQITIDDRVVRVRAGHSQLPGERAHSRRHPGRAGEHRPGRIRRGTAVTTVGPRCVVAIVSGLVSQGDSAFGRLSDALDRLGALTRERHRVGVSHEDADEDLGTVATDDAIGFNPLPLLRALDACCAHVVVMGQVAGIMHGSRELTGDLDLLWDGNTAQAPALAAAFASVSAELADADGMPVHCGPVAFGLPKVLFRTETASGDCCTPRLAWGGLSVGDFIGRSEAATAPDGFVIRYLARADLISMRRAVGRPKDLRRAAELEDLASQP
jgi:hypothetical protein